MKKIILLMFLMFSISGALAASILSSPSVCCQRTIDGGICINSQDQSSCDSSFSIVPSSCESTSFCKMGTCYDSKEGMCLENVPMEVCQGNGGTWSEKSADELPVCQLGCCVISDQAAFVTKTRCKSLSTFYGIEIDFRPNINSEVECIAVANAQDMGACVYYEDTVKTCKFTTRKECGGTESTIMLDANPFEDQSGRRFYKNTLCSNEELDTDCARQMKTGCYKEQVYWFDSCGNRENIYSSDSEASWNKGKVADPDDICAEVGDSKTCGNCDYLLGSRCSEWTTGLLGIGKPKNVNNYCKTTKCIDRDGKTRMNGESWCVYDTAIGEGTDPAGSRSYREVCVDGEVKVEACEDFRNQICIHSGIDSSSGEYSVATCRVNRWQDCTTQTTKDSCENVDARDCIWVEKPVGVSFGIKNSSTPSSQFTNQAPNPSEGSSFTNTVDSASQVVDAAKPIASMVGNVIKHIVGSGVGQFEEIDRNKLRTNRTSEDEGLCVPMSSPGSQFWEEGSSSSICAQASAKCDVIVRKKEEYKSDILGTFGGKKYEYTIFIRLENGTEVLAKDLPSSESCIIITDESKGEYEPNPAWAAKVNAVCSALGDCGADVNVNGVFTDYGYEWKFQNSSYFFTQADLGIVRGTKLGKGTGEVVAIDYIINEKYKLNEDDHVYIKQ